MKVKTLQLQNYGRFENLTMEFAPNDDIKGNVTIIVGNNGAGKSQILQALVDGLGQIISYMLNGTRELEIKENLVIFNTITGHRIPDLHINNHKLSANIDIELDFCEQYSFVKFGCDRSGIICNYEGKSRVELSKNLFDNLQFFLQSMHSNKDIEINFPILALYGTNRGVESVKIDENSDKNSHQILLGYMAYAIAEAEYNRFFRWFREKEDIENEQQKYSHKKILQLAENLEKNKNHQILDDFIDAIQNLEYKDYSVLKYVKKAIELFTDFEDIHIERKGTPTMYVEKDGEKLDVNQLSQGEKSLLALVGDIARRLAILNPNLENPLEGQGVVLIDEVDLHLHPKWQQNLIDKLTKTFPNVQFILTTHSPHIVSDKSDVLVYILDNGELKQYNNAYGEDANTLLNGVFGVSEFTPEIAEKFAEIRRAISHKDLEKAENIIQELSDILSPNNSELLKLQLYLAKAKVIQNKAS